MENLIYVALTALVSSFGGSYVGSYLKKKGEIIATHENMDKLVDQMTAVTQATKKIEAKIEDEVWNRQRRWELKRDTLFDATKRLTEVGDAVYGWDAICALMNKEPNQDWNDDLRGAVDRWVRAYDEYGVSVALVGMVCSKKALNPLEKLADYLNRLDGHIHQTSPGVEHNLEMLDVLVKEAKVAIRQEINS